MKRELKLIIEKLVNEKLIVVNELEGELRAGACSYFDADSNEELYHAISDEEFETAICIEPLFLDEQPVDDEPLISGYYISQGGNDLGYLKLETYDFEQYEKSLRDNILTTKDICKLLDINRDAVSKLDLRGRLTPFIKQSRVKLYSKRAVERYLESRYKRIEK